MADLAIIGGTGLTSLAGLEVVRQEVVSTPYGEPSSPIVHGVFCGKAVAFLARHGQAANIPPHRVSYRANLWAVKHIGADKVIAVNAVGGIRPDLQRPGAVAIPDQIIDYTYSRGHTFFDDALANVVHIDFTEPYCEALRAVLLEGARRAGVDAVARATYGATQGPRLESAAEVDRLERDGCDIVGMTGMPEAALARELGLCYAACAVVANAAAGRGPGPISMEEIDRNLKAGMDAVRALVAEAMALI